MADVKVFDFGDGVERNIHDVTARENATAASTAATIALQTAESASTLATTAKTAADDAATAASEAKSTADTAQTTANSAKAIAEAAAPQNTIAPVENGDTSSADYVAGKFIYHNGLFYKVIADIATGDAFVVDTNIEQTIVSDNFGKGGDTPVAKVVYGFHVDGGESDPASKITYLEDAARMTPAYMDYTNSKFDYGSWQDAFFMPKPCMVKYDGTVDYYLDPNDYTKKEDGTTSDVADTNYGGNAMVEWPKIYMKIVPDSDGNDSFSVYISNTQVDEDYHAWPYINSAGVEQEHFYSAIYNSSEIGSRARSISGQAVMYSKTADGEKMLLRANNAGSNVLWDMEMYSDRMLITALLMLIGKSTNTQAVFGNGLATGSQSAFIAYRTGALNTSGLFFGYSDQTHAVKVFGMENYWALQFRRLTGLLIANGVIKIKLCYGQSDGSTQDDYDFVGGGFVNVGEYPSSSSKYVTHVKATERGIIPYNNTTGSDSTYYCDYFYINNSITAVPLVGGTSDYGLGCGAFCFQLGSAASASGWHRGAALSMRAA